MRFKREFTRLSRKGAVPKGGITHQTEGEHVGRRAVLHNPYAEQMVGAQYQRGWCQQGKTMPNRGQRPLKRSRIGVEGKHQPNV